MNGIEVAVVATKSPFHDFDKFQGTPRSVLEHRITELLAYIRRQATEEKRAYDQLTHVQERCTEQELELRKHRAESKLAGTPVGDFLLEAAHELTLAQAKHSWVDKDRNFGFVALTEEVGEVAKAILDEEAIDSFRRECAQCVAVLCRLVTEAS